MIQISTQSFCLNKKNILFCLLTFFVGPIFCAAIQPEELAIPQRSICLEDIFEDVVGVPEILPLDINFIRKGDGCYYLTNTKRSKEFCCGKIEHSTVAELRTLDGFKNPTSDHKPSFRVICYSGRDRQALIQADVSALQANPENMDAVFMLATRMHGLEGGCVHGGETYIAGLGFNRMLRGPAQGEFASLSGAPGSIYRIYGYEPINLLGNTPLAKFIDPKSSGGGMPYIEDIIDDIELSKDWTDNLNIYFHENIDVVVGRQISSYSREIVSGNRINQVLAASFDWRLSNKHPFSGVCMANSLTSEGRQKLRKINGQMLSKFYEGTLLSAALKDKHKIFLTAVGGGCFSNDLDIIFEAIANPRNLEIIKKYGLEVILVVHGSVELWMQSMNSFWSSSGIAYAFTVI